MQRKKMNGCCWSLFSHKSLYSQDVVHAAAFRAKNKGERNCREAQLRDRYRAEKVPPWNRWRGRGVEQKRCCPGKGGEQIVNGLFRYRWDSE